MINSSQLVGERIRALAELIGVSRTSLAESVGASITQISKIENGTQRFPLQLALDFSEFYEVPISFFMQIDRVLEHTVPTFRKQARALASEQKRITRLVREAGRLFKKVSLDSSYRTFPTFNDSDLLADIEQVAKEIRRAGNISLDGPVPNVTRLLERQGVGIIHSLDPSLDRTTSATGISLPSTLNDRPLIGIVGPTPAAVSRFTLAHEAAHLIWDTDLTAPLTSTRDYREKRANRFAGALLLPEKVIRDFITERSTLRSLLPLKAEFGVSLGAIIFRAKDLKCISDDRARSLQIQLSSLGWRDPEIEPVEVTPERPLLLRQAFERVARLNNFNATNYSGLPTKLVNHWLEIAEANDEKSTDKNADIIDITQLKRPI
ncbi:MAG: ImmA/IrrE family metallo-endopeptidase [Actinomycetaceae bacterium]|nr:ImmA/IrrE family metallo-endopeptidase [Actinomycetaceae bacterium]